MIQFLHCLVTLLSHYFSEQLGARTFLWMLSLSHTVPLMSDHVNLFFIHYFSEQLGGMNPYVDAFSTSYGSSSPSPDLSFIPSQLWTAQLQKGFVGCIAEMKVRGNSLDVVSIYTWQMHMLERYKRCLKKL